MGWVCRRPGTRVAAAGLRHVPLIHLEQELGRGLRFRRRCGGNTGSDSAGQHTAWRKIAWVGLVRTTGSIRDL